MGACTFSYIVRLKAADDKSISQAFNDLREAARADARSDSEDGESEGYSGTIAEKGTLVKISSHRILNRREAETLSEKLIDMEDPRISDKWGPAGVIVFTNEASQIFGLFFGWASE